MTRLWSLGGLAVKELARRVWTEIQDDDVLGQAAELSFYFLLALFPLLLFLTALLGHFTQSAELRDSLLDYFRRVVPRSAFHLVVTTIDEIGKGAGQGKLSLGILGSLWAASSGVAAIAEGINRSYDIKESRPWWKARLIAVLLTLALAIFTLVSFLLVVYGGIIGEWIAQHFGLAHTFSDFWNIVRWPIAILIALAAFDLLYRFAPDLKRMRWAWTTPGSLVAVALWLLVSLGFRLYLRFFNSFNATYGSLGALIILMLWLYFSGAAILIGAEVNSEIEHAAARAGDFTLRLPGERAPGELRGRRPPAGAPLPASHSGSEGGGRLSDGSG
jgi:membrane protein